MFQKYHPYPGQPQERASTLTEDWQILHTQMKLQSNLYPATLGYGLKEQPTPDQNPLTFLYFVCVYMHTQVPMWIHVGQKAFCPSQTFSIIWVPVSNSGHFLTYKYHPWLTLYSKRCLFILFLLFFLRERVSLQTGLQLTLQNQELHWTPNPHSLHFLRAWWQVCIIIPSMWFWGQSLGLPAC